LGFAVTTAKDGSDVQTRKISSLKGAESLLLDAFKAGRGIASIVDTDGQEWTPGQVFEARYDNWKAKQSAAHHETGSDRGYKLLGINRAGRTSGIFRANSARLAHAVRTGLWRDGWSIVKLFDAQGREVSPKEFSAADIAEWRGKGFAITSVDKGGSNVSVQEASSGRNDAWLAKRWILGNFKLGRRITKIVDADGWEWSTVQIFEASYDQWRAEQIIVPKPWAAVKQKPYLLKAEMASAELSERSFEARDAPSAYWIHEQLEQDGYQAISVTAPDGQDLDLWKLAAARDDQFIADFRIRNEGAMPYLVKGEIPGRPQSICLAKDREEARRAEVGMLRDGYRNLHVIAPDGQQLDRF
jgi:hypothetical protein